MNNYLLACAGLISLSGALHSGLGEYLILTRLQPEHLPTTPFGGPRMSLQLLRGTWHLLSFVWIGLAAALLIFAGDARAVGIAQTVAVLFSLMGLGMVVNNPKMALRHPAPILFLSVAVTAWLGCR